MQPVFFGHDDRVEAGTTAFMHSVISTASKPIALTPITRRNCPGIAEGSNSFTLRRFLVPWMLGYRGWAAFVDGSDMLCRADLGELFEHIYHNDAVRVVKHAYATRNPRKYCGTGMECENLDYERKQWAAVMLINCGHFAWRKVTPEFVRFANPLDLLQFRFLPDALIGELPVTFNWLCDEHGFNSEAKILHWTTGSPAFQAYQNSPHAEEFHEAIRQATGARG